MIEMLVAMRGEDGKARPAEALGYQAGRYLPYSPRLTATLLWLVRHLPDRVLFEPANRWLAEAWRRYTESAGASPALAPRIAAAADWIAVTA